MEQDNTRWRPTTRQVLWLLGIVALLILGGYTAGWTGFGETTFTKETTHYKDSTTTIDVAQDPRRAKTLWDWLQLLIVPAALAAGGFLLNRALAERQRAADEAQREREQVTQEQRTQDAALQEYLNHMSY